MDYESSVLVAVQQLPETYDDWSTATAVSSHPLLAHRMIRRFTKDLREFQDHTFQSLESGTDKRADIFLPFC